MKTTTITIGLAIKRRLDQLKLHRRESYNDVLDRALLRKGCADEESLRETAEILSDPETMRSLARSLEDMRKGRLYDFDEV